MHLAILMTNTDESDFAQRHPKDGEKFTALIQSVRPDWKLTSFSVKDDIFPADMFGFDGVIITGSPASVNDPAPWGARLRDLIRQMFDDCVPMFGACYGHQAIALALNGAVTENPNGWIFGSTRAKILDRQPWMDPLPDDFPLYAAHKRSRVAPAKGRTHNRGIWRLPKCRVCNRYARLHDPKSPRNDARICRGLGRRI